MGRTVNRTRNHRRKGCGSCESITLAHHYLTSQPENIFEKLKTFKDMNIYCELVDDKYIYAFSDGSMLAFSEARGLYKIDCFLRKTQKRLA